MGSASSLSSSTASSSFSSDSMAASSSPAPASGSRSRSGSWSVTAAAFGSSPPRGTARPSCSRSPKREKDDDAERRADRDPAGGGQPRRRASHAGGPAGRQGPEQLAPGGGRGSGVGPPPAHGQAQPSTPARPDSARPEPTEEGRPGGTRRDQAGRGAPAHSRGDPHDLAGRAGHPRELPAPRQRLRHEAGGSGAVPQGRPVHRAFLARDREAVAHMSPAPRSTPIEVLLVEDNPDDAALALRALRQAKLRNRVHLATTGVEALAFLRREGSHAAAPRPDLILLDLNLPLQDGREVLAEITLGGGGPVRVGLTQDEGPRQAVTMLQKEGFNAILLDLSLPDSQGLETFTRAHAEAPTAPSVVLTGLRDEEMAVRAVREGAQDYLVKGQVDGHGLYQAIRYAIERQRGDDALRESEQRFRELAENVREVFFIVDPETGRSLYLSPAYDDVFGHSREHAYAAPNAWLDTVPPEDRGRMLEAMFASEIGRA